MLITVDVVVDLVCPWCYIGKRNLEAAARLVQAQRPEVQVAYRWLPFFLNPETPTEGEPYLPFLEQKFGGPEAVERIQARVRDAGRAAGIDFAFERIAVRPSSLGGHRMIQRLQAMEAAPQAVDCLVERLFAGYFLLGENIGDPAVLQRIAEDCGQYDAATHAFLASAAGSEAVLRMAGEAQAAGIGGVPFFIINGHSAQAGAQPPELLAEAMLASIAG